MIKRVQQTFDSWVNAVTGMGTSIDKVTSATFYGSARVSDSTIRSLIGSDDLARKIVMKKPKEMLRQGFFIQVADEIDKQKADDVEEYFNGLGLYASLYQAMWLGRAYGGAILILGIDGAGEAEEPIEKEQAIDAIRWLKVVDRRYVQPLSANKGPVGLNSPEYYRVAMRGSSSVGAMTDIHESRVIRFDGATTDPDEKVENQGWDQSVLQEALDPLSMFSQTWQGVANGMTDWSQAVFKLKNLIHMIAEGKSETLQKRMQVVNMARSMARAVIIDADSEEFSRDSSSFTGIEGILDKMMMRIASVVEMPVTLLFGKSPDGMNSTGDADFRNFYDTIRTDQQLSLKPKLRKLFSLAFRSTMFSGEPENWDIVFNPLWQMTEGEMAEIRLKQSQVDTVYLDREVVYPEEVARSRFSGQYSTETRIDLDLRDRTFEIVKEESLGGSSEEDQ